MDESLERLQEIYIAKCQLVADFRNVIERLRDILQPEIEPQMANKIQIYEPNNIEPNNNVNESDIVNRMLIHNELQGNDLIELVNIFIRFLNRHQNQFNLQMIDSVASNYIPVGDQRKDLQILRGVSDGMPYYMCILFKSNESPPPINGIIESYRHNDQLHTIHPDLHTKDVVKRLYNPNIMQAWRQKKCSNFDDGLGCDCSAVLAIADAILVVRNIDPTKFRYRQAQPHGTGLIRVMLKEIYDRNKLDLDFIAEN